MTETRRRRLAWLFALVLLMELAVLGCALVHLGDHECAGHDACAICRYMRLAMRGGFAMPAAILTLLAPAVIRAARPGRPVRFASGTLFALKVRLND